MPKRTPEEIRQAEAQFRNRCRAEVEWYRRHGQFPTQRIAQTRDRVEYVIGDWSWNRKYPYNREFVEPQMLRALPPTGELR